MRRTAAAIAVACILVAGPGWASPEDLFGYGARTSAMGATGAAHATGYETAYHNPALASAIRAPKLTLGWSGATFGVEAQSGTVGGEVPASAAKGVIAGIAAPIPFGGVLAHRVGFAVALYTPSDVVVRGRVLYPETPQFPLLAGRADAVTIRAGLGAEIGWGVRVGIGLAALAEVRGAVDTSADATGRVDTRVDNQLVATYAPAIGVTFEPPRSKLRLGATFRGALDARFDVLVDATKLSTLPIPRFDIAGVVDYDPAQLAVEIAHIEPLAGGPVRVSSVLAAQVVYKRWRDFAGFLAPTVVCSEGAPGSCGLAPPTIGWRDTFAVRVGAEEGFELAPGVVLHGRGGGFLETSALPSDLPTSDAFDVPTKTTVKVPTRYFDASRLALTTGAGVSILEPLPLTVDLFLQYHVLLPRTVAAYDVSGHGKVFGLTLGVQL